mmetsp:Transcript_45906/g.49534  ORF Transcript_45906/g.49534 Transcript_45906/m.49534 type:complete len:611 (+) Transcript_45906:348-2180(+)
MLLPPKTIILSFDDGPNNTTTPLLLDALRAADVRASFFVVGVNIDNTQLMHRMVSEGHLLGSHTWSHDHLPKLNYDELIQNLQLTEDKFLEHVGFSKAYIIRFPYGDADKRTLGFFHNRNYTAIGWDLDTFDWKNKTESQVVQAVNQLLDGLLGRSAGKSSGDKSESSSGILLMHEFQWTTMAATAIVEAIHNHGFRIGEPTEILDVHTHTLIVESVCPLYPHTLLCKDWNWKQKQPKLTITTRFGNEWFLPVYIHVCWIMVGVVVVTRLFPIVKLKLVATKTINSLHVQLLRRLRLQRRYYNYYSNYFTMIFIIGIICFWVVTTFMLHYGAIISSSSDDDTSGSIMKSNGFQNNKSKTNKIGLDMLLANTINSGGKIKKIQDNKNKDKKERHTEPHSQDHISSSSSISSSLYHGMQQVDREHNFVEALELIKIDFRNTPTDDNELILYYCNTPRTIFKPGNNRISSFKLIKTKTTINRNNNSKNTMNKNTNNTDFVIEQRTINNNGEGIDDYYCPAGWPCTQMEPQYKLVDACNGFDKTLKYVCDPDPIRTNSCWIANNGLEGCCNDDNDNDGHEYICRQQQQQNSDTNNFAPVEEAFSPTDICHRLNK